MLEYGHSLPILAAGPLRIMLLALVAVLAVAGPIADPAYPVTVADLLRNAIAPAMAVIIVFVVMLDILMCRIFMSGKKGDELQRYRGIIRFELVALAALLLSWTPFIMRIVSLSNR